MDHSEWKALFNKDQDRNLRLRNHRVVSTSRQSWDLLVATLENIFISFITISIMSNLYE